MIVTETYKRVAACGLDCTRCDMLLMVEDEAIQERILGWFHDQGWLAANEGMETVLAKGMYCKGCKVDSQAFWSSRCEIAICCVDDKGLAHCGECDEFPCQVIAEHAARDTKYAEGVDYLRQWRAKADA